MRRWYGVSLGQMFSGEITPDEAWDMIIHLPRTSATMAALADDPEIEPGDPQPMSWTEFSPERETLALIADLHQALLANVIALGGGKPPKLPPHPRPGEAKRAALKAARHERARSEWNEILRGFGVPEV